MFKYLILLSLPVFFFSCKQENTTPERTVVNAICDRFMKAFTDGRYNDAFVALKANTVIADSSIDNLLQTVQVQMKGVADQYGKPISYEFVDDKTVGDFIARRIYVLRFEKYYLTFNFILYKGSKDWRITKFAYTEGSDQLL